MKKYLDFYKQNNLSRVVLEENRKRGEHVVSYGGFNFVVKENVFSPEIFNGNKLFTPVLEKNIKNGDSMIEIGCGSGITGLYLAKKKKLSKLVLADINPDAVENAKLNAVNLGLDEKTSVYKSDVFDQIPEKQYDIIYWNHPWLPEEENYKYKDELDKGLFDPNYKYLTKYIEGLKRFSKDNTRVFLGFGDFGDIVELEKICNNNNYHSVEIASEKGDENGDVNFILFEIIKK